MLEFGVIGYGGRISSIVDLLFKSGEARPVAIMDTDIRAAKARAEEKGYSDLRYYSDADEMLQKEQLDGVLVGTRCSTHTHYAVLVAKYKIPLFLEKPVCIHEEDLDRLRAILPDMDDITVVSFPLRTSMLLQKVKEITDTGRLGTIEHVQAYNNVPYGRGYYHKWYRDENETGGLFLQKATHDLDYINYLLGDNRPVRICAVKSKQVFKGNEPAGKLCADCDKTDTCPESPKNVKKNGDRYIIGPYCCFATDTGNEDSGSAIIEYESGMHVVYSQNFIARNGAGKRGARLIGYRGTLEFDWVTNTIRVFRHLENINEEYVLNGTSGSHFGGDANLCENFLAVMTGKARSIAPLHEGILSASMCLAARRSSEEHVFVDIRE
ncbi:MAG: Gfo/Idh/MocA family oxidoreductase [Ruminococcaceae bacterium]|nr:Gfo/Idh/MocA family oxidoreductase [Oscillospiraceae bacterium]